MKNINDTALAELAEAPGSAFALYVRCEIERARAGHRPINSVHEGYAVILEELDEFWEEVKKKREHRDKRAMYLELVQVAAMAQRTAEDVLDADTPRVPCAVCDRGDYQLGHADGCSQNEKGQR